MDKMTIRCKTSKDMKMIKQALACDSSILTVNEVNDKTFTLTGECLFEGDIRLIIQKYLDENSNIKGFVLLEGNTVCPTKSLIKEFKHLKKVKYTKRMSNKFYDFMYQHFTIAHYNKSGWIDYYPTYSDVVQILENNAKGIPTWHTDLQVIVDKMLAIA